MDLNPGLYQDRPDESYFTPTELKWFATGCYNLALAKSNMWPFEIMRDLYEVATQVSCNQPLPK